MVREPGKVKSLIVMKLWVIPLHVGITVTGISRVDLSASIREPVNPTSVAAGPPPTIVLEVVAQERDSPE